MLSPLKDCTYLTIIGFLDLFFLPDQILFIDGVFLFV